MKKKWNLTILIVFLIIILFLFIQPIQAGTLKVTNEHPFLIDNKWVGAKDLVVGDLIKTIDGKLARITNIYDVSLKKPISVYNLEASVFHDFVVGEDKLIVHNSNYPPFPKFPETKPDSWSITGWNEYLLDRSGKFPNRNYNKRLTKVGDQIVHFEGDIDYAGTGGAVFMIEGSSPKRVVKVTRGDQLIRESKDIISEAVRGEKYYLREIENMKLADRLDLRKYYGEVEIDNAGGLLDSSVYPQNKYLLRNRAYEMDYVDGGWPSEMKEYITSKTLADAIGKYRKLWDAGYVQNDFQFFVTYEGKVEIIDWGGVIPKCEWDSWGRVLSNIKIQLGICNP